MIRNYYHQVTSKFPYHFSWWRCMPLLWSSVGEDKMSLVAFWLAKLTYETSTTKWPVSFPITFRDKNVYCYFEVHMLNLTKCQKQPYNRHKWLEVATTKWSVPSHEWLFLIRDKTSRPVSSQKVSGLYEMK